MKREVSIDRLSTAEAFLYVPLLVLVLALVTDHLRDVRCSSARFAVSDLAKRKCTQRRWIDPWGMPYAVYCGHSANVAQSFGPDRIPNTSDDIWSNR